MAVPLGTKFQTLPQYAKESDELASGILTKVPEHIKTLFCKHLERGNKEGLEGIALREAFTEWAVFLVSAYDKIAEQRNEVEE